MSTAKAPRRRILLVEDNPGDVRLLRESFGQRADPPEILDVPDGVAALELLRAGGGRPDLVLLDLNLPRMDGREFLATVKGDPALRKIPVVVLTSSGAEADVERLYDLHANGYLLKPRDLSALFQLAALVDEYWLRASVLPGREGIPGRADTGGRAR